MSEFDAYQDDMERIANLSEQEIDRLLAGKLASGEGDLGELATFLQEMRVLLEPSSGEADAQNIAAIVGAAQIGAAETAPPEPGESLPKRERSGHTRFRLWRKPMRAKLLLTTAGLLLLMAFGGAAYAGALPGPVQGTVADFAGNVGVDLPGGDVDDGPVGNVDDGPMGDVDDGPMGDVDDGPVGDR